jgi:drug/metabolite transporter (DMT)-like permease
MTDGLRARWARQPGNLRGGAYAVIGVLTFAASITLIKILGQRLPVIQMVFIAIAVQLALAALADRRVVRGLTDRNQAPRQVLRAGLMIIAQIGGFYAVIHMPLADATAVSFTKGLFVVVLAALILREVVGWRRAAATCAGFLGIIVLANPAGASVGWGIIAAVVSSLSMASATIMTRIMAAQERTSVMIVFQTLLTVVVLSPFALALWLPPTPWEWLMLVIIGGCGIIGNWAMIASLRVGEAAAMVPVDYLRLVFTTLLGLAVFAEVPTLAGLLGAAIIVGASIYSFSLDARGLR